MPDEQKNSIIDGYAIAKLIRSDIVHEVYQPLERLIESDLSIKLGTTRPVVHKALEYLETQGLVELIPRKGFIVSKITIDKAVQIYQAREAVEGMVCQLFALNATALQIKRFSQAIDNLEKAAELPQDKSELLQAKNYVYDVLVEGCGNAIITAFLRSLRHRISWLRARTLSQEERPIQTVNELRKILIAVQAGDPEQARQASVYHVREAAKVAYSEISTEG